MATEYVMWGINASKLVQHVQNGLPQVKLANTDKDAQWLEIQIACGPTNICLWTSNLGIAFAGFGVFGRNQKDGDGRHA